MFNFLSKNFTFKHKNLLFSNFLNKMSSLADADKIFETLNFDNLALRRLPIESVQDNYTREVKNAYF